MNEEMARMILKKIHRDRACWLASGEVMLEGIFSTTELEAIIWRKKNPLPVLDEITAPRAVCEVCGEPAMCMRMDPINAADPQSGVTCYQPGPPRYRCTKHGEEWQ